MQIKLDTLTALPRLLALGACLGFASPVALAFYQDEPEPQEEETAEAATEEEAPNDDADGGKEGKKEDKKKTLEDIVENHETYEGLFTLYRDPENGAVHMEIAKDQIDQEFIYYTMALDGVLEAGSFRGAYGDNEVFSIRKFYDRIEFVEENVNFYFDPDSPLARAKDANISPAVLATAKVVAESEDGESLLIKADGIFLAEALTQVSPTPRPGAKPTETFKVGGLAKDKSKIREIKNYPANTDVIVDYVFNNPKPLVGGSDAVTDARSVTVKVQHTLVAMPENDFTPRIGDSRIGYFDVRVTDLTSHDVTPYRDLINRWNLKKKNPGAAVSDPVEPIVWWIENTTPLEYRDAIKEGVLAWNKAFEAAGFSNALEVRVQPDDADWDAGDIRYNVLRWTSSPIPPFGGYGPSHVNPRTGQIIGSDIMLEQAFVTNRVRFTKLFDKAGLAMDEGFDAETPFTGEFAARCSFGEFLSLNNAFARTVLAASYQPNVNEERLIYESLVELTLHEVGHTLGLNHNMKSSQLHGPDDIHNIELTREVGLTGSVMDYAPTNIALEGEKQGEFYITTPGPYDMWAIKFGYSDEMEDPSKRSALLSRSGEPELAFGNDADDMRAPGRGIDPRIMIGDMTSDAITYAQGQMRLARDTMGKIMDRMTEDGESWAALRQSYLVLTSQQATAAGVVSRYIGGVEVDRTYKGDPTPAKAPYTAVDGATQRRAVKVIADEVFAPEAFAVPGELLRHLQVERRGYELFGTTEDPSVHSRILNIQSRIFDHVFHPNVVARLTDSSLYGNDYSFAEVASDMSDAVFEADMRGDVNTQRRNLQVEYVNRLIGLMDGSYDHVAKAAAHANLVKIDEWMDRARRGNEETRAHRQYIRYLIEQALYPGGRA